MTKARDRARMFLSAIGALSAALPGDHIHFTAPSNNQSQSTSDRLAQIDRANAKRARKMERNRKLVKT